MRLRSAEVPHWLFPVVVLTLVLGYVVFNFHWHSPFVGHGAAMAGLPPRR